MICNDRNIDVDPSLSYQVGVGDNVTFPVLADKNRGIRTDNVLGTMSSTSYSFGFYSYFELLKVKNVSIASLNADQVSSTIEANNTKYSTSERTLSPGNRVMYISPKIKPNDTKSS